MSSVRQDIKEFYLEVRQQDFGFFMAAAYIFFSYLRPQAIYPEIDILPWTQLCIISGLFYSLFKGYFKFQISHFAILIFLIICLISSYLSYYQENSFSKLDVIVIWFIEVIFFTNCIRNIRQFRLITIFFYLFIFKISFFGARTWILRGFGFRDFGISGPHGFFENSGELSLLMAMVAIMSISFLHNNEKSNPIYLILPITSIMTVIAASSRGGQLALAVGLFMILISFGKLKFKNLIFIICIGWLIFNFIPEQQKERFLSAGSDNTSKSRLLYWSKGLEMLDKHPWFGVGYFSFPNYFDENYSYLIPKDSFYSNRKEVSHNTLIEVSSTLGYIGLISFLYLYWVVFKLNRQIRNILSSHEYDKKKKWIIAYTRGLDISMIVFFIGSFFMSVAFYPYIFLMLMFSQSLKNATLNEYPTRKKR